MSITIGLGVNTQELAAGLKRAKDDISKTFDTLRNKVEVAQANLQIANAKFKESQQRLIEMAKAGDTSSAKFQILSANTTKLRLGIESAEQKLDSARRSLSNFEEGSNDAGRSMNSLQSIAMKAAGVFAGLFAASKVIEWGKQVVKSTEETGDAFEAAMGGMTEAGNYLARSIATLDFSNLISGLEKASRAGAEYVKKLDEIGDRQRAVGIQKEDVQVEIERQRMIARDRSRDMDERQAAIDKIIELNRQQFVKNKELADMEVNAETELAAARSGLRKEQIAELITNYDRYSSILAKYAELDKKLREQATEITVTHVGDQLIKDKTFNTEKYNDSLSALSEVERTYIRWAKGFNLVTEEGTGGRVKITEAIKKQSAAEREMVDIEGSLVRLRNSLFNELIKEEKQVLKTAEAYQVLQKDTTAALMPVIGPGGRDKSLPAKLAPVSKKPTWLPDETLIPEQLKGFDLFIQKLSEVDLSYQKLSDTQKSFADSFMKFSQMEIRTAAEVANAIRAAIKQEIAAYLAVTIANAIKAESKWGLPGLITGAIAGVAFTALFDQMVPKFAKGGIVTRPTLGIFGEAGPEAVVPLKDMGRFGMGGGQLQVEVVGTISGRELRIGNKYGQNQMYAITGRKA